MNPARLTVVPEPERTVEVVAATIMLRASDSIHLTTDGQGYTLRVSNGRGMVHLDYEAARRLWRELDANLLLDEARNRLLPGEPIDQITPSTAEFLRMDGPRDAAADEARDQS